MGNKVFLVTWFIIAPGHLAERFEYDYCPINESAQVYSEAQEYFDYIFDSFQVPWDPKTCPFHPSNLDFTRESQHIGQWKRAKPQAGGSVRCPYCQKTFKSADYLEFHLKTQHAAKLEKAAFKYEDGTEVV